VQGRLILLPAVNAPAAEAGRRTSPVDGLNFNRVFPGNPRGTMTEQIAAFLADELFPRADAFIDLHSGGSSLDILPSAAVEPAADPEHYRRNIAAARAFGAPVTTVISNLGDPRTATAAAVAAGLVAMGTEMGGGGRVSPGALALCRQGLGRVLAHLGVLEAPEGPPPAPGRLLELPGTRAFVHATADGVFEPVGAPGDPVHAGEPAGRIHFPLDPLREPETLLWQADGILYGLRQPGRVRPGNCCAVVAAPFAGAL
jgi:predicted deacylase